MDLTSGIFAAALAGIGFVLAKRGTSGRKEGFVVRDRKSFEAKRKAIVGGGFDRLQFVADFDRTLTKAFTSSGAPNCSCHGMLEHCPTLSENYRRLTQALARKYYPIETDPRLTMEQKLPKMTEWYSKAHEALKDEGISRADIVQAVKHANTELRDGARELLDTLGAHGVPTLLFSAGIEDLILEYMQTKGGGALPSTMHVVSNKIRWDASGKIAGFYDPLIHMFNKDDRHTVDSPWFKAARDRSSVILIGDSLGDVTMASRSVKRKKGRSAAAAGGSKAGSEAGGASEDVDVVLRIGFLNARADDKIEASLPKYLQAYDAVILHDGDMGPVLSILREMLDSRDAASSKGGASKAPGGDAAAGAAGGGGGGGGSSGSGSGVSS